MKEIIKKYYLYIIIGIVVLILIIISFNNNDDALVFNPPIATEEIEETKYIYVDIKGEVMNPGVYKVEDKTRLFQLIVLAGGITGDADTLTFNLSLTLRDEQVIYIPSISEEYPLITDGIDNELGGIVNINRATLEQLDTLPGIGPATAQNIIDYRNENGDFLNIEDIIEVPGIGEATLNEIRELIIT